jgi:hypothetical protein
MVFPRQGARRGKADAPFGRVRLLPVIADGDSRARLPEPEMRGQSTHLESQRAPLPPPIPVGPAGVAEIQSDQMDITLMPLPLVIEPAAACAIMFHSQ